MAKKKKPRREYGGGSYSYYEKMKRYRAYFVDPDGTRINECFIEESDAKDWLALKKAEVIQQEYITPSDDALGPFSLYYLETFCKTGLRARTYEGYSSLLTHANPIAAIPMQELKPDDFVNLYASIDRSGSTKKKLHQLLKQILRQAVVENKIKRNPMDGIPKAAVPKTGHKEIETFTPEEIALIFKTAEGNFYENLFLLFLVTGMRLSEGLGLRLTDFDSSLHRVHIRQTLHRSLDHGLIFEAPKSTASKRHISIPVEISMKLARREHLHPTLLFSNTEGGPLMSDVAIRAWTKLLKEAGVPYRGLHTLRHTHATLRLKAGTPITEVSRRLGHARVSTTLDVYSHAIPADDLAIVNTIANIYSLR